MDNNVRNLDKVWAENSKLKLKIELLLDLIERLGLNEQKIKKEVKEKTENSE